MFLYKHQLLPSIVRSVFLEWFGEKYGIREQKIESILFFTWVLFVRLAIRRRPKMCLVMVNYFLFSRAHSPADISDNCLRWKEKHINENYGDTLTGDWLTEWKCWTVTFSLCFHFSNSLINVFGFLIEESMHFMCFRLNEIEYMIETKCLLDMIH